MAGKRTKKRVSYRTTDRIKQLEHDNEVLRHAAAAYAVAVAVLTAALAECTAVAS